MEDNRRLAALRDQITLFEGETALEGWAVERLGRGNRQPGLALLTNWRLIVADIGGGFCAIPTAKIDRIESPSPTTVRLTAWYETISLDLESAAVATTLVNCLRQDLERRAVIGQGRDLAARPPYETAAPVVRPNPIWPTSTIDRQPGGPARESVDQRLLMVEPSL